MTEPPRDEDTWPQLGTSATLLETREAYGPPPPPPPDRRIGTGMLVGLGALALVGLGFLITYLVLHRDNGTHQASPPRAARASTPVTGTAATTQGATSAAMVPVPDLRGVQATQARSALSSVGLKPRQTTVASSRSRGTVVAESPRPGAHVVKGSQVLLSLARGTPRSATTTGATTSGATTTAAATTTAPTTTASAPPPPRTVTVPDVSGRQESDAVQAFGRAGLLPALEFVPSDDPLGTVEGQGKASGTTVPYQTHVRLNLSTGPGQKPSEQVPNVIGRRLRQAVSSLNAAGLRLIYLKYPVGSKAKAGTIVQQSPLGGGTAPKNAQVLVFMAAYQG